METRNDNENTNLLRSVDWFTIVLYLIMVVAGAVSIYAATYDYDRASMFDLSEYSGKQFLWAGLSFLIGFSLLRLVERQSLGRLNQQPPRITRCCDSSRLVGCSVP